MKRGRQPRMVGIREPEETGKYRVWFRNPEGELAFRDVWFFKGEVLMSDLLTDIRPERIDPDPLPGTRPSEWPRIADASEDAITALFVALFDRARKDYLYSGISEAGRRHRESARLFLAQFEGGRAWMAAQRKKAEIAAKRRRENFKKRGK